MSRKLLPYLVAFTLILGMTALMTVPTVAGGQPLAALALNAETVRQSPAASILVNDLGDTAGTCPITCTLRAAINLANSNIGADTITFSVSGIITLASPLPAITEEVAIDGSAQSITVSGASTYQVLHANTSIPLTLNALTIANGNCSGCDGGGIYAGGALTLTNVISQQHRDRLWRRGVCGWRGDTQRWAVPEQSLHGCSMRWRRVAGERHAHADGHAIPQQHGA
jgi:CSLREA domain-containing protein